MKLLFAHTIFNRLSCRKKHFDDDIQISKYDLRATNDWKFSIVLVAINICATGLPAYALWAVIYMCLKMSQQKTTNMILCAIFKCVECKNLGFAVKEKKTASIEFLHSNAIIYFSIQRAFYYRTVYRARIALHEPLRITIASSAREYHYRP